ncbi:MAG: transcription initiation factor TFIIIB, partial [Candidatus Nitrosotenuis sp.]|nr:transcription initiation factor TFIIIB [Candidatus Nitrosotenuis sp.]
RILIENFDLSVTSYDSSDFVSRIANSLGVSERTKRGALDLLHDAKRQGLAEGKNPVAMAATSIYLSCLINKETHSQRKIASVSGISEVTVRNRAKNLVQQLTVLKNLQNIVG